MFKGYEEVVVQDVVAHTDNILFLKEKFYSPACMLPLPRRVRLPHHCTIL